MRRRSAFTLLEIMLVLAVLVVVAAMTMPALGRIVETQRLRQSADQVRAAWMRTHLTAMRTGKLQMFRFENNGVKYRIETWHTAEEDVESATAVDDPNSRFAAASQQDSAPSLEEGEHTLPDDVSFAAGNADDDGRAQKVEDEVSRSGAAGASWSRPILFYPDGSTSTAHVVVANAKGRAIRVDLRGLTGGVKVGEIELLAGRSP